MTDRKPTGINTLTPPTTQYEGRTIFSRANDEWCNQRSGVCPKERLEEQLASKDKRIKELEALVEPRGEIIERQIKEIATLKAKIAKLEEKVEAFEIAEG